MTNSESSQIWINAGYELFAREGPDGIQIERLARIVNRNKSGFYHHFGERDLFLLELMQYHDRKVDEFCLEGSLLKRFFPDYLDLLAKYKPSTLVQMQLRRNSFNPSFNESFIRSRKKTDKVLLPLWATYLKITNNDNLVKELWNIMRDVFFMRVRWENLTNEFLYKQVQDFSYVIDNVKRTSYLSEISALTRIRQTVLPK